MKKAITVITLFLLLMGNVNAQKYLTKSGHINFFSKAPMEDIEADNHQVNSIVDSETGEMVFSVLMKGFHFEKALMEEHFNEKYVHSEKFPKSTFKGQIVNLTDIDMGSDAPQQAEVKGTLTLHGISQDVSATGTLKFSDDKIYADAVFEVSVQDYDIEIPRVVKNNIAEIIKVTVAMIYEPYHN